MAPATKVSPLPKSAKAPFLGGGGVEPRAPEDEVWPGKAPFEGSCDDRERVPSDTDVSARCCIVRYCKGPASEGVVPGQATNNLGVWEISCESQRCSRVVGIPLYALVCRGRYRRPPRRAHDFAAALRFLRGPRTRWELRCSLEMAARLSFAAAAVSAVVALGLPGSRPNEYGS